MEHKRILNQFPKSREVIQQELMQNRRTQMSAWKWRGSESVSPAWKHESGRGEELSEPPTDCWVQQMKTTCWNGKHLKKKGGGGGKRSSFVCKKEYQSVEFPLREDTHASSPGAQRERHRQGGRPPPPPEPVRTWQRLAPPGGSSGAALPPTSSGSARSALIPRVCVFESV